MSVGVGVRAYHISGVAFQGLWYGSMVKGTLIKHACRLVRSSYCILLLVFMSWEQPAIHALHPRRTTPGMQVIHPEGGKYFICSTFHLRPPTLKLAWLLSILPQSHIALFSCYRRLHYGGRSLGERTFPTSVWSHRLLHDME